LKTTLPAPGNREQRFIRLAHHRPSDSGKTASDYVAVQIDSSLDFDPMHFKIGRLLRLRSHITGPPVVDFFVAINRKTTKSDGEIIKELIRFKESV
jgi:hypothetical protein